MADREKIVPELKETLRFTLSSMIAAILDYTVYILMYEVFSISDINLCYSVAKGIGAVENFYFNNYIVFRKKGQKGVLKRFALYILMVVISATAGNLIISALHDSIGIPALYAKLLTDTSTFLISFISQKYFIFKKNSDGNPNR